MSPASTRSSSKAKKKPTRSKEKKAKTKKNTMQQETSNESINGNRSENDDMFTENSATDDETSNEVEEPERSEGKLDVHANDSLNSEHQSSFTVEDGAGLVDNNPKDDESDFSTDFDEANPTKQNTPQRSNVQKPCVKKGVQQDTDSKSSLIFKFLRSLAIAAIMLAVLWPFVLELVSNFSSQRDESRLERFRADFAEIKATFPNQGIKLWRVTKFALEGNLKTENNREPAILMLASNQSAYSTTQCLARKLSQAFSKKCNDTYGVKVDGVGLKGLDGTSAKAEVDRILEKGFRSGACSAIVSRLESLPAFATTTFYQYCENDNAPFKNVAVIFTVQIEDGGWNTDGYKLNDLPQNEWDLLVNEYLTKSLKSRDPARMTDEMVSALLSRITPSVVWVTKEPSLKHC